LKTCIFFAFFNTKNHDKSLDLTLPKMGVLAF
jgi:hypothetical protein